MLTKFWEGVGSELAKRWLAYVLEPVLAFYGIGLLAWAAHTPDPWQKVDVFWSGLEMPAQVAALVAGLLGLVASSAVVRWLQLPVLRLLEGYWPRRLAALRRWRVGRVRARLDKRKARYQRLRARVREHGLESLPAGARQDYASLDREIVLGYPPGDTQLMPTALGNRLRAAEEAPRQRYGLDTVVVWPHLWLLLPKEVQEALGEARAQLDGAVRLVMWGTLSLVWLVWAWWVVIPALVLILVAYLRAVDVAEVYGALLRAAFDLHRLKLYEALRWPLPETSGTAERAAGERLTMFLYRGLTESPVAYCKD